MAWRNSFSFGGVMPISPQAAGDDRVLAPASPASSMPQRNTLRAQSFDNLQDRTTLLSSQQRRTSILKLRSYSLAQGGMPTIAQSLAPQETPQDFGEVLNAELARLKDYIDRSGEKLLSAHQALARTPTSSSRLTENFFQKTMHAAPHLQSDGAAPSSPSGGSHIRETFRVPRKAAPTNLGEIEELTIEEQSMADEIERRKTSKGSAGPSGRKGSKESPFGSEAPPCETCSTAKTEVVKRICLEGGRESIVAVEEVEEVEETEVMDILHESESPRRHSASSGHSQQSKRSVAELLVKLKSQNQDSTAEAAALAQELCDELSECSDDGEDLFELLPIWSTEQSGARANGLHNVEAKRSIINKLTFKFKDVWKSEGDLEAIDSGDRSRFIALHPGSALRVWWDMISIILVSYDMVIIPFMLFIPPLVFWMTAIAWVTRIFWSLDIPLSFVTGFIKSDGSLEVHLRMVARRYVCRWFSLDFLLVAIDWTEVIVLDRPGRTPNGAFRILRLIRLLRIIRMGHVTSLILARMHSERLLLFADIFKIFIVVIATSHLIACTWYGIGRPGNPTQTWINQHVPNHIDLGHRYAMALHWALSQFTGGMDEIRPANSVERIFAVCMFIFAFMLSAIIVSSLTSSMTRLHFIASYQSKQFFQLRRYLIQNSISEELTLRIQRNAKHAILERQHFMEETNVDLLGFVSEPLRIELHFELYSPVLEVHPFFARYILECPQVMRKVCHRATAMNVVSTGDAIFDIGEIPSVPKMYFLCSGTMQYVSMSGQVDIVEAIQWISEASLWTQWMHIGVLTATSECRLVVLDARKFQDICEQFSHSGYNPREYALQFVEELNNTEEEVTDLPLSTQKRVHPHMKKQMTRRMAMRLK